eukprot:TRINITY_DN2047_c0_g1_i2.p1 TRINITY_DN2047_c0_g1~~TRINITY_DN2047_c0_g1_i2.p1  ORF type:complete len:570 (+),score=168.45 TRINITY_DN2047_c0_g1_i2:131-1840(+)
MEVANQLKHLGDGIIVDPMPEKLDLDMSVPHAPKRSVKLTDKEFKLALKNALRYFPETVHNVLAPEFAHELRKYGHIYMYRFRPTEYEMKAHPFQAYPAKCGQAKAIQLMIMNNLDKAVAQFPHELITYGGNGSVFSNWAQYRLTMKYLTEMSEEQTLVMMSGHPQGIFPSHKDAPRCVITNGMVIPNYSGKEMYEKMYALGVSMYGQMTAGSYCYIGPQGIVHGTTITVLNAGRKYLGIEDMSGKVYLSSGLGGMSGAQPKAGVICGCIAVIAEVDEAPLLKRHAQGWVQRIARTVDECIEMIREAKIAKKPLSIGFHGNVVALWERLAELDEKLVDLGSDQTSLHNPFKGGYYPVQLSFEESQRMMVEEPEKFKEAVQESLRRHVAAINKLSAEKDLHFWDYGNSFLLEASRANADVAHPSGDDTRFKYPSYVQDIMGDVFSLGFGPYRWVCTSQDADDLAFTDKLAGDILEDLAKKSPERVASQMMDNVKWIRAAGENKMVVGSQARILYADREARATIAQAMNAAVKEGKLKAPVVISRDHHDVSGTDSPVSQIFFELDNNSLLE